MSFGKLFLGALLVGVGVVLLGTSLGFLSRDVWPSLLQYWPLLVVAIGIAFLAQAIKNVVLGWISAVIVIGGLLLGAWWFTTHQPEAAGQGARTSINLAGSRARTVTFRGESLLGRIEIGAETDTARAIRLETRHVPEKMTRAFGWTVSGSDGVLTWPARNGTGGVPPIGGGVRVELPPRTHTGLRLKADLSTVDADFSSLRPERATFRVAGSSIRVVATATGEPQRIRIQGFLSNARILLPAGPPVRVVYSRWFGLHRMPSDFIRHVHDGRRDQVYRSDGHGGLIVIEVRGPLLRVVIEREPARAVGRDADDRGRLALAPGTIAHTP